MIAAAQQPTANWIGNALRLMLTDDRFAVTMSGGRGSAGQALNEVLWEDTPTQNFIGRWATRDTRLGGRQIKEGDCVVLGLAAANTDPEVRPDAYARRRRQQRARVLQPRRAPLPVPGARTGRGDRRHRRWRCCSDGALLGA